MLSRKAFTLIELLVVIAIIAIVAVVVVVVLNPAELLKQSRDSSRISDMSTLTDALGIYTEDVGSNIGSVSTTYVSVPDPTATSTSGDQCQGLGLPTLPAGDVYQCPSSSTFRNIDGTGWIPINFKSISFGNPLTEMPVDPINTTSTGLYYTYTTDGIHYGITHAMESNKYASLCATDGGQYNDLCVAGTNLALAPLDFYADSQPGFIVFNAPKNFNAIANTTISYVFSDTASDTVNLAATGVSFGGGCPTLGMKKPDGTTLVSGLFCGSGNSFNNITLPISGTYTVFFNPSSGAATGTLLLSRPSTGAIALNTHVAIGSTYAGQDISYSFSGTTGEVVNFAAFGISFNGSCPTLGIQNPDGSTLSSNLFCGSTDSFNNLTLPTTGVYSMYLNPGTSAISTGTLTVSSNLTNALAFNIPTHVTSTLSGQYISFTFPASTNEAIDVSLASVTDTSGCPTLGIQNSSGTTLSSNLFCGSSDSYNNIVLTSAGTDTIFLNPGSGAVAGTFTLTNPLNAGTLTVGTPATASSSLPGQFIYETFSGSASTTVSLSGSGISDTNGCPTMGILTPSSTNLSSSLTCGSTDSLSHVTLPVTGTYSAYLNPGSGAGGITFSLTTP